MKKNINLNTVKNIELCSISISNTKDSKMSDKVLECICNVLWFGKPNVKHKKLFVQ